jgi:hypothetical protein
LLALTYSRSRRTHPSAPRCRSYVGQ